MEIDLTSLGALGEKVVVHTDCTELFKAFAKAPFIIHDTETNGLNPYEPNIPMWNSETGEMTLTDGAEPFCHFVGFYDDEADLLHVGYVSSRDEANMATLREFMLNPSMAKVGHNYKFDMGVCRKLWEVKGPIFDTLTASHMLYDRLPSHTLKYLGNYFTGTGNTPDRYEQVVKKFLSAKRADARKAHPTVKKYALDKTKVPKAIAKDIKEQIDRKYNYSLLPEDLLIPYGVKDIVYTFVLFTAFVEPISEHQALFEFEMDITRMVLRMEERGIEIDPEYSEASLRETRLRAEKHMNAAKLLAYNIRDGFDKTLAVPPARFNFVPEDWSDERKATALYLWESMVSMYRVEKKDKIPAEASGAFYKMRLEMEKKPSDPDLIASFGDVLEYISYCDLMSKPTAEINVGSSKQLLWILRDCLGISDKVLTNKQKKVSTDKEIMQRLDARYPENAFFRELLLARTYAKLYFYFKGFKKFTGEYKAPTLHCTLRVSETATGRTACADPNLQNIPNVKGVDVSVRRTFVPRKGKQFLFYDYSQIEMIIFALFCQEPMMLNAFKEGKDFHNICSMMLFGDTEPDHRKSCKAVGFGLIYGMGGDKLADTLGLPLAEALQFKRTYLDMIPRYSEFSRMCSRSLRENGYVEDIFGRQYHLPLDQQYKAVNSLVQGASANVLKMAMLQLDRYIAYHALYRPDSPLGQCQILLPIHDELIIEAPEGMSHGHKAMIRAIMEDISPLKPYDVKAKVEGSEGLSTWAEKTPLEFDEKTLDKARSIVYATNKSAIENRGITLLCPPTTAKKVDWFIPEY